MYKCFLGTTYIVMNLKQIQISSHTNSLQFPYYLSKTFKISRNNCLISKCLRYIIVIMYILCIYRLKCVLLGQCDCTLTFRFEDIKIIQLSFFLFFLQAHKSQTSIFSTAVLPWKGVNAVTPISYTPNKG